MKCKMKINLEKITYVLIGLIIFVILGRSVIFEKEAKDIADNSLNYEDCIKNLEDESYFYSFFVVNYCKDKVSLEVLSVCEVSCDEIASICESFDS